MLRAKSVLSRSAGEYKPVGNALRRRGVDLEQRVLLALLDGPEFLYRLSEQSKRAQWPYRSILGCGRTITNTYSLIRARGFAVVSEAALLEIQQLPRGRRSYLKEIVLVGKTNSGVQSSQRR